MRLAKHSKASVDDFHVCWTLLMVSSLALSEMDRGIGGAFDREFGRNEMGMSRNNFGDSFERGMGSYFQDFA